MKKYEREFDSEDSLDPLDEIEQGLCKFYIESTSEEDYKIWDIINKYKFKGKVTEILQKRHNPKGVSIAHYSDYDAMGFTRTVYDFSSIEELESYCQFKAKRRIIRKRINYRKDKKREEALEKWRKEAEYRLKNKISDGKIIPHSTKEASQFVLIADSESRGLEYEDRNEIMEKVRLIVGQNKYRGIMSNGYLRPAPHKYTINDVITTINKC